MGSGKAATTVRTFVALSAALLIGAQAVRTASVSALIETSPRRAALVWAGHPEVELMTKMAQSNSAAPSSNPKAIATARPLRDVAVKEPLASEPFLVLAIAAQHEGQEQRAQRLFEEAQWRDPRSIVAADFLAQRYYRTAALGRAAVEMGALSRLAVPEAVAGSFADYARDQRMWPALRGIFETNPRLRDLALANLASETSGVPAVLALAGSRRQWVRAPWFARLLETLAGAGEYQRARHLWLAAIGPRDEGQLLYDSSFSDQTSPGPFNWAIDSSSVGVAKRRPGGRLQLLFRGREDGFLASQMLLLSPGPYILQMRLEARPSEAHAFSWSLWCDKSGAPLVSRTLEDVAAHGLKFDVPPGCPAQWLRLAGVSFNGAHPAEATISALTLRRAGTRG